MKLYEETCSNYWFGDNFNSSIFPHPLQREDFECGHQRDFFILCEKGWDTIGPGLCMEAIWSPGLVFGPKKFSSPTPNPLGHLQSWRAKVAKVALDYVLIIQNNILRN